MISHPVYPSKRLSGIWVKPAQTKHQLTATDPCTGMVYTRTFTSESALSIARENYQANGFTTNTKRIRA